MPETCRTTYVIAALSLTATGLLLAAGAEMLQSMLYTSLRLAPGRVSTSPAADTAMPRPPVRLVADRKTAAPAAPAAGLELESRRGAGSRAGLAPGGRRDGAGRPNQIGLRVAV